MDVASTAVLLALVLVTGILVFVGGGFAVGWIWLTNVALLFGAELNAEIEREKELREGVPSRDTLNRPPRGG